MPPLVTDSRPPLPAQPPASESPNVPVRASADESEGAKTRPDFLTILLRAFAAWNT